MVNDMNGLQEYPSIICRRLNLIALNAGCEASDRSAHPDPHRGRGREVPSAEVCSTHHGGHDLCAFDPLFHNEPSLDGSVASPLKPQTLELLSQMNNIDTG
jgi:hypothetical protein